MSVCLLPGGGGWRRTYYTQVVGVSIAVSLELMPGRFALPGTSATMVGCGALSELTPAGDRLWIAHSWVTTGG